MSDEPKRTTPGKMLRDIPRSPPPSGEITVVWEWGTRGPTLVKNQAGE